MPETETKQRRRYNKIAPEHLAYAKRRFSQEFASTSAVRAELKAMGADYPHGALHHYWTQANPPTNGDPGDEAQGGGC